MGKLVEIMPIQKVSFEDSLKKTVVERLLCTGCASCVISCPYNCLEYVDGGPKLVGECKICGVCAQVCPRFNFSMSSLEHFVFGRERNANEEFGIYKRILIARTKSREIMDVCQDGGVVTSLLVCAIEDGLISGAALSGKSLDKPLKGVPKLALSKSDILACSGTRYTYSPNILALKDAVQRKIGKIAFIGTPCQIHAVRRMQMLPLKKYADPVKFTVGLFCTESFNYDNLIRQLSKTSINPNNIAKMNIKGKLILKMRDGAIKTLPLKDIKAAACNFCSACTDFSAELADISAGGLGLNEWTLTIVRTEVGDEIVRRAEAKGIIESKPLEDRRVIDLLIKLSRSKRERGEQNP
jgi:coenzyme F420 hydrogenase subunit beta